MKPIFYLPDVGEGIAEATIIRLCVQSGDSVTTDSIICEVETDKSIIDIPAPYSGVIGNILVQEGQCIQVGQPIFEYQDSKEASNSIAGSLSETTIKAPTFVQRPEMNQTHLAQSQKHWLDTSWQTIPHTYIFDHIYTQYKPKNITANCLSACSLALKKFPELNAIGNSKHIKTNVTHTVGCAIDHDDKTVVLILDEASLQSQNLINDSIRAAQKTLTEGGQLNNTLKTSIIVSNIGMITGQHATPIIYPPSTMMLAVGQLSTCFLPNQATLKPELHYGIPLSFVFNHHLTTGANAARFLKYIKEMFEVLSQPAVAT
ncbi:MAG: 2-oxo acid dehydrogenase subunit E2 [Candidatus Comchoanobacterales bacterium]